MEKWEYMYVWTTSNGTVTAVNGNWLQPPEGQRLFSYINSLDD